MIFQNCLISIKKDKGYEGIMNIKKILTVIYACGILSSYSSNADELSVFSSSGIKLNLLENQEDIIMDLDVIVRKVIWEFGESLVFDQNGLSGVFIDKRLIHIALKEREGGCLYNGLAIGDSQLKIFQIYENNKLYNIDYSDDGSHLSIQFRNLEEEWMYEEGFPSIFFELENGFIIRIDIGYPLP